VSSDRSRALAKTELETLPENRMWPPQAEIVYADAYGTWEGHGYDNFMMSASLNRYFVGPYQFDDVVEWYEKHMTSLGWPHGAQVESADGTPWHQWRWELEVLDLIDRLIRPGDPLAQTPAKWRGGRLASELQPGSWIWSVTYQREPAPGAVRPASVTPPSEEEMFDTGFRLLEKFVAREGSADVPLYHLEEGFGLGVWASNMRFEQANIGIREHWAARLESLPGWRWLPGNDFFLVERYALREGTTRIPEDYVEEGRPLGRWVAQQRRLHASGQLANDWVERIERIPGWEW
jgi:uncharacterized protein YheU (UPF0270 family)